MRPEKCACLWLLLVLPFHRAEASDQQQQQPQAQESQVPQLFGLDFGVPPEAQELAVYQMGKRARKMSAFMPMRGRKDGRDEQLVQLRELDPDSPSILRLVAGGQRLAGPRQFAVALRRANEGHPSGDFTGANEPIMEAKLRRAFHPMRGKKWALEPTELVDELELAEM